MNSPNKQNKQERMYYVRLFYKVGEGTINSLGVKGVSCRGRYDSIVLCVVTIYVRLTSHQQT